MPKLLAPLRVGDQIPWKMSRCGEPLWLTVVEVLSDSSYSVRYPDGRIEILTDCD
jgi:hypothetical protein